MKKMKSKRISAFTLTEILIVLVIIGILILLALPNLMPLITKAKYTEAKLQLEHVYTLEKSYFFENSKYTSDLSSIGFIQEDLNSESVSGKANYLLEITQASTASFVARATAVVDFDGDGVYNVWEIDQDKNLKEVIPD